MLKKSTGFDKLLKYAKKNEKESHAKVFRHFRYTIELFFHQLFYKLA